MKHKKFINKYEIVLYFNDCKIIVRLKLGRRCVLCGIKNPAIPIFGNSLIGYYFSKEVLGFSNPIHFCCVDCCQHDPIKKQMTEDNWRCSMYPNIFK